MYLDFSKADSSTPPTLRLRTMSGKELGVIRNAYDISLEINYSEVSTIQFSIPKSPKGEGDELYDQLTSYKEVYTEDWGRYILTAPSTSSDGISEIKTVTGYSIEHLFSKKHLFLQEGTYNFWDPVNPADTILGRLVELDSSWSVGYVSPALFERYRTFDEYSGDALSFFYGVAHEKYQCVVVFDPYKKTMSAYDNGAQAVSSPVFLSTKNLLSEINIEEISDEITTKLHVRGADDLDISGVNPLGGDALIEFNYFASHGDLDVVVQGKDGAPVNLADRVKEWQLLVEYNRQGYSALVAVQSETASKIVVKEAELSELKHEARNLTEQQNVVIQAVELETTEEGKNTHNQELFRIGMLLERNDSLITFCENDINSLKQEKATYTGLINELHNKISYDAFFTEEEKRLLAPYLLEGDLVEETFVASDSTLDSYSEFFVTDGDVELKDSLITQIEPPGVVVGKKFLVFERGLLSVKTTPGLTAEVISGTIEWGAMQGEEFSFVLTAYLANVVFDAKPYQSGVFTVFGSCKYMSHDLASGDSPILTGTHLTASLRESSSCLTFGTNEYLRYSVCKELYDYGRKALTEMAWPSYEFSLKSANFISDSVFTPFKNSLKLGETIYVNTKDDLVLSPKVIGLQINFDAPQDLTLVFSNRYKLRNGVEILSDTIQQAASNGKKFSSKRHVYNKAVGAASKTSEFISGSLDAARNTILASGNQSVVIDNAGIRVGTESDKQIRIVDSMIAMTDDRWKTAKLAIGQFANPSGGTYWGVNADVIAGTLVAGKSLVIESEKQNSGVVSFKFDSNGAILNNATISSVNDAGTQVIMDPYVGFAIGRWPLYKNENTHEIDTGKAGFWVDPDGNVRLKGVLEGCSGKFTGVVQASEFKDLNGKSVLTSDYKIAPEYLELKGINVANKFIVSEAGEVTINGNVTMSGGKIEWANINESDSAAYTKAGDALKLATENKVTPENVFNTLTSGGEKFGIFSESDSTGLYINASYIKAGMLNADKITLGSKWGGFKCATGMGDSAITHGAMMYGGHPSFYFIATDQGVRMQSSKHGITVTDGGLSADEEIAIGSDSRIKNSVSYDMKKYQEFFLGLKPSAYKLNKGQSGRYHLGFIAQDVETAIRDAGLSTQDFAGFVKVDESKNFYNDVSGQMYLRYSDFIALNTYMIQQLWKEIEALKPKNSLQGTR